MTERCKVCGAVFQPVNAQGPVTYGDETKGFLVGLGGPEDEVCSAACRDQEQGRLEAEYAAMIADVPEGFVDNGCD